MRNPLPPLVVACVLVGTSAAAQPANRSYTQTIAALDDAIADVSALHAQIEAAHVRGDTPAALNASRRHPTNPCAGVTIPSWRACVQRVDGKVSRLNIDASQARAIRDDLGRLEFSLRDAQSSYTEWLAAVRRALQKLQQQRNGATQNLSG